MARSTEDEGDGEGFMIPQRFLPTVLAVLAAAGVGLGSYSTVQVEDLSRNPGARPDAWTRSDALQQANQLRGEIRDAQREMQATLNAIDTRVDELEKCRAIVYERLGRVIETLDRLEDKHHNRFNLNTD